MTSVLMPHLGETAAEGTIARWLKRPGDHVAKDEPLLEVITDKVNVEVPAPESGVLARILAPDGQTVRPGAAIALLEPAERRGPAAGGHAPPDHAGEGRKRLSPLVRRLAKEHRVNLDLVPGTGAGGRITKEDMLAYIGAPAEPPAEPPPAAPAGAAPGAPPFAPAAAESDRAPAAASPDEEVVPATPMRRAIAEHMVRSVTTAPHAWTYVEVDVAGLVQWRERVRHDFQQREGFRLSYVPFVAKALVETLREHPVLNSTWRDGAVALKRRIHLGVAVALEEGLIVPVIRDADEKSIAGLARALDDLVVRARAGALAVEDVQGGTFTLNNTGALGSVLSMPIIPQPQAAILTMEAITRRVVALPDGAIAVRPLLNLCLSFDHRVCDGLQVGRFMQALKRRLEAMRPDASIY